MVQSYASLTRQTVRVFYLYTLKHYSLSLYYYSDGLNHFD